MRVTVIIYQFNKLIFCLILLGMFGRVLIKKSLGIIDFNSSKM